VHTLSSDFAVVFISIMTNTKHQMLQSIVIFGQYKAPSFTQQMNDNVEAVLQRVLGADVTTLVLAHLQSLEILHRIQTADNDELLELLESVDSRYQLSCLERLQESMVGHGNNLDTTRALPVLLCLLEAQRDNLAVQVVASNLVLQTCLFRCPFPTLVVHRTTNNDNDAMAAVIRTSLDYSNACATTMHGCCVNTAPTLLLLSLGGERSLLASITRTMHYPTTQNGLPVALIKLRQLEQLLQAAEQPIVES
jgi:hypothetical protein